MNTFTKILLTSVALTLAACDPDDLGDADFGDEASEFRPGFGSYSLNTSFIGGHDYDELDLMGAFHEFVKVKKVCLSVGNKPCLFPGVATKGTIPDRLWVEKSQLFGKKGDQLFKGKDFAMSRWFLELDHDRNGVIDSTIELEISNVKAQMTVATIPVEFWNYAWAFDSKTATGLVSKFIEQQPTPTPMCEVDPDTGSLDSVLLENTHLDTSPTTKGIVEFRENSMFVACHSSASGKLPGDWGYAMHDVGRKAYTNLIRAVRADYGNDGKSFTKPGQVVAVTDDLGVNKDHDGALQLEGLISLESGWLCVYVPRLVPLADVVAAYPNITICDERAIVGDTVNGTVSNMMIQPVP